MTISLSKAEIKKLINLLQCEITDYEQMLEAVSSPSVVMHCAKELGKLRGIIRKLNSVINQGKDGK